MLVGGYAVALHGWPRTTFDIDFWIVANPENARAVMRAIAAFGAPLQGLTEADFHRPGMVFQIGVEPQRIDIISAVDGLDYADASLRAERMNVDRREAKELIGSYFATYPDVKRYMDDVVARATEQGYVATMFGRRRILHDINSSNRTVRGLAERNAINAPIQGSAADIMKLAMVEIFRRFRAEGIRSKMIMQVHDEVVIDTLNSELDKVKRIVKESMESVATLRVPLIAEVNNAPTWLDAH